MPTEIFGNVRQKFFDGNLLYPLLSIKFFDTSNYLEHWGDAPRSFSVLWDPNISPENAIPFIIHKTFRYPKFSETLSGCAQNFSALWDKKVSTEKCDTPYYAKNFPLPQIIWNIEGMSTKLFGNVRQKFFDGNLLYPLLSIKFFDTSNCLEHWRDVPRSFSVLWDPKFSPENAIPFIIHETFRYPKFSETLSGCAQNFSALWDKKGSTEKCDTP